MQIERDWEGLGVKKGRYPWILPGMVALAEPGTCLKGVLTPT